MSPEALRELADNEPNVFCTWEFYEYEIQSTPVLRGPQAQFNFTSKYIVKVDDFFLHYLQKVTFLFCNYIYNGECHSISGKRAQFFPNYSDGDARRP